MKQDNAKARTLHKKSRDAAHAKIIYNSVIEALNRARLDQVRGDDLSEAAPRRFFNDGQYRERKKASSRAD
jgi:hypothetical protein